MHTIHKDKMITNQLEEMDLSVCQVNDEEVRWTKGQKNLNGWLIE
jgi:hypothetical protein